MQTQRRFWKGFQQYNVVNLVVSFCIISCLFWYFADLAPSAKAAEAHKMSVAAKAPVVATAPKEPKVSIRQEKAVIHSDAQKWKIPSELLLPAPHNPLGMAGSSMPLPASMLQGSAGNIFPYRQCTWWANQRYHQLHGNFVPWRNHANASQWVKRALEANWHVSSTPTVGSIMVLQPYVDGAYGLGHVGIVERILPNGRVIASSMNWGKHPEMVTQATYALGPGVKFLSNY